MFLHPIVGFNAWQARGGNVLSGIQYIDTALCRQPKYGAEGTVARNCKRFRSFCMMVGHGDINISMTIYTRTAGCLSCRPTADQYWKARGARIHCGGDPNARTDFEIAFAKSKFPLIDAAATSGMALVQRHGLWLSLTI